VEIAAAALSTFENGEFNGFLGFDESFVNISDPPIQVILEKPTIFCILKGLITAVWGTNDED
jgi:hypothetical protein